MHNSPKMPPAVVPKRNVVRKPSRVYSTVPLVLSTTHSSENLARPVTRTEFQELAQLVAQLKKESSRQVTIGKCATLHPRYCDIYPIQLIRLKLQTRRQLT